MVLTIFIQDGRCTLQYWQHAGPSQEKSHSSCQRSGEIFNTPTPTHIHKAINDINTAPYLEVKEHQVSCIKTGRHTCIPSTFTAHCYELLKGIILPFLSSFSYYSVTALSHQAMVSIFLSLAGINMNQTPHALIHTLKIKLSSSSCS